MVKKSGECLNCSKILEFVDFFPKIPEILENSFWCLKFQNNSGIM